MKSNKSSIKIYVITFITFLFLNSCKVSLIPNFDSGIYQQIEITSKSVDKFYLLMLETTKPENEGRKFEKFIEKYVDIEIEITSLLNKNKIRPLNTNSTRVCEITLELWQKYKEEHRKDNTLSDGLIKLNRKTFGDLFYAMQVAEKGKEIVNKK